MSHRAATAALRFRTLPSVGGTAAPRAGRRGAAIASRSRRGIIGAQRGAASSYDYSSSSSSIVSPHLTTAARTTVDDDDVDRSSNDHDGDIAVHPPNTGSPLYFQRRSHPRPSHHPRHHHHQRRLFASGSSGFVPGGRGMGRDGGGRGSGRASAAGRNGPSHQPGRGGGAGGGGAGGGGAGAGGRGAGAFERFRAKREAAQREQREREAAAAAAAAGGAAAGSEAYETPTTAATTKKKFHRGGDKKANVARTFLEPASRGELVGKHDSGIPKLLAKKKKSLTVHDDFPDKEAETLLREEQQRAVDALDEEEYSVGGEGYVDDEAVAARASKGGGGGGARSILTELRERRRESVIGKYAQPTRGMQPLEHREYDSVFADEDYVSDDEYDDDLHDEPLPKYEDHPDVVQRPDGRYELRDGAWADEDEDDDDSDDEVDLLDDGTPEYARAKAESRKIYSNDPRSMVPIPGIGGDNVRDPDTDEVMQTNPDEDFFYPDIMNFTMKFSDAPLPYANQLRPLENECGDGLDNFLQANLEHPTKYAEVRRTNLHPDSRREAKPIIPKNRAEPPREWVERYKGYLYVMNLSHPVFGEDGVINHQGDDGADESASKAATAELGEYENPLHRHEVAVTAANLFDVEVTDVYPTNMTSAFVGFKTQRDAKIAWKTKNLDKRVQEISVSMTKLSDGNNDNDEEAIMPESVKEFVQSAEGGAASIVQLTNVPPGMAPGTLVRSLFPPQSDLEKMLGPIDPKADVAFRSPTAALVKFANADRATLAVHYKDLQERLDTFTTRRVRIFRAMRERVHDTFAGPNRWAQVKKRGSRLIVDGDLPPQEFYVSHTSVMHLRNVPDDLTKRDLAALVQPFCVEHRDVAGSAHVVTCADGVPTGRVFVGFDRDGEAEAFFKAHSIDPNRGGRWNVNGHVVMVKPVKDKGLRRGNRSEERSSRQVAELLDDLNSWEKHVDPDDVEELERLGVSREVLGEALTALRYHNRSFGSVDQAAKGERLRPERLAGTHYRDMCRLYVSVLKECSSTPENPGLMYEAMFQPGEEVETESVFEYERERIEELRKKHG